MDESYYIWMSHVTYEWVMAHKNDIAIFCEEQRLESIATYNTNELCHRK